VSLKISTNTADFVFFDAKLYFNLTIYFCSKVIFLSYIIDGETNSIWIMIYKLDEWMFGYLPHVPTLRHELST